MKPKFLIVFEDWAMYDGEDEAEALKKFKLDYPCAKIKLVRETKSK